MGLIFVKERICMQKNIWVLAFVCSLAIAAVIGYFLWPEDKPKQPTKSQETQAILEQLDTIKPSSLDAAADAGLVEAASELKPDVQDLTDLQPISFESEKAVLTTSKTPRNRDAPADITIYTNEGAVSKHAYIIPRFDEDGNKLDEIKVLEESFLPDGSVAVTLELQSGEIAHQKQAVINGGERGYAINLNTWDYADIPLVELKVMFEKGDFIAGLQVGHLLLLQGKPEQASHYLVASAKATGFSRPIDLIAHYELSQNKLIEAAAWGRVASHYSGIDDIVHKIKKNISGEDSVLIEARTEEIKQKFAID
jgi:hypothetical protein